MKPIKRIIVSVLDTVGGWIFDGGAAVINWSGVLDQRWGTGVWDHGPFEDDEDES
jgi:hypothetical protein